MSPQFHYNALFVIYVYQYVRQQVGNIFQLFRHYASQSNHSF